MVWRYRAGTCVSTTDERRSATALSRSLATAQAIVAAGETDVATILAAAGAELDDPLIETDYLQIVNPTTLEPITQHQWARARAGRGKGWAGTPDRQPDALNGSNELPTACRGGKQHEE